MKIGFGLVLGLLMVLFIGMGVPGCLAKAYTYKVTIGQYMNLADDASTASKKLEYLVKYREACRKIGRNDARFFFKQEQFTRDAQLGVLETLIVRLTDAVGMDQKGVEYQQAMYQISGQEFETAMLRIDAVMDDCYMRSSLFIWLWGVWFFVGSLFGLGLLVWMVYCYEL